MSTSLRTRQFGGIVAIVVILGAALWLGARGRGRGIQEQAYFYDLAEGRLYAAAKDIVPPDENGGVRAAVYSCRACDADDWQIVYLLTYVPEAHNVLINTSDQNWSLDQQKAVEDAKTLGLRIAPLPPAGQEPAWIPVVAPQGQQLKTAYMKLCPQGQATMCLPG